jgi:TonB-linked SusC/RagA family outer membrane protein
MKRSLLISCLSVLFPLFLFSQTRQVTGRVTDSRDQAVPLASILVKGTTTGVSADENGRFTIMVPADGILIISSTGFRTQEVRINNASDFYPVTLAPSDQLSEVVVTALGIRKEKRALGYSAQEVKGEDIFKSRQSNVVNALQGQAAGLQINSSGGAPGQGARIVMRGITSLDPSRPFQPLFVVDGIPIDNNTDVGGSGDLRGLSNRAADLNPDDIETISVLRGGAATALYGLRGSTGVIVITTKSGRAGRLRAGVTSTVGIEEVNKYPETQGLYTQGFLNAYDKTSFWPSWGPTVAAARGIDPTHPESIYNNFKRGYQKGNFYRNTINVSGGTDKALFAGSFSQFNHEGVMPFSDYKNYSVKVNGDLKFSEKFRMGTSVNYINSGGDRKNADRYNEQLSYWAPRWDVRDYIKPDGTMKYYGVENDNPMYIAYTNRYRDNVNRVIANTNFVWSPFSWLDFSYRAGADMFNDARTHTAPGPLGLVDEFHPADNEAGFLEEYRVNKRILNSTAIANLNFNFNEDFNLSVKIGHDVFDEKVKTLYAYGDTLVVPTFFNMANAKKITGSNYERKYRIIGVFADWSMSYKNFLYLTLTGRNDWTSTLAEENRSFFYPSASISYIFSQSFQMPTWMSFGKVRASVAKIGKDALPYATSTGYNIGAPFSNNVLPFTLSDGTGDPSLRPEFTTSYEAGAELRFLGNRLGVDFTYYNNTSKDLIIPVKIPISSGFDQIYLNAGSIRNKGIEISLSGTPVQTSGLTWEARVNYSRNQNRVLDIYPGLTEIAVASHFGYLSSTVTQKYIPGYPVGALFGRSYARYYGSDTEDPLLIDDNRPVLIGANGFPVMNTRQKYLANSQPDWIGSIYNSFTAGQFSLSFLFDAQQGMEKYNQMANFMSAFGIAKYTENRNETIVFDGVTADGAPNKKPVFLGMGIGPDGVDYGNGFYRNVHRGNSQNFIEDASWIRLRNVTATYALRSSWLAKTKFISGASVSLTGNNLWLHTDYSGFDPEGSSFSSGSVVDGFTGFTYPSTRSYIVTVNLTF